MNSHKFSWFILLLGCGYLLFLVSSVQPGTFFSGDGGMKYLVVKQIQAGQGFKALHLSQPDSVRTIWNQGFFPFDKPFIYPSPNGYIFSFPPAFQLVSAPLYSAFGYAGLYIIPLLSTVLLWIWALVLFNTAKAAAFKKNLGLFILIFCAPLTLYGSIYWEHTFAVLLLFGGVFFIVANKVSLPSAAAMGFLSGLAVWLRPETIIMNSLYALAIIYFYWRSRRKEATVFIAAMGIAMLAFLVFNKMVYGPWLGVHSYQFIEEHSVVYKLMRGVKYAGVINWNLLKYFCFVLLLLPVIFNIVKRKWPLDKRINALVSIAVLFCGLTPFMVPNTGGGQWGPRYLLPVMPVIIVALVLAWQQLEIKMAKLPLLVNGFLVLAIVYCLYLNVYEGGMGRIRKENYTRVKPALDYVKQQTEQNIIVNTQFIPMEMSDLFTGRYFYLAENETKVKQLLEIFRQKGIHTILYVADPGISEPSQLIRNSAVDSIRTRNYLIERYSIQ